MYLHKALAIRDGAEPDPWPPSELADEEPLALLDRSYAELLAEFANHDPRDAAGSWYTPDQTVGFWIRRMAQETVIHRIDSELATGQPVAPIPADMAVDGSGWLVRTGPGTFAVSDGVSDGDTDVRVSGAPQAVLRWLWNREGANDPSDVRVEGSREVVDELRGCIATATQ